MNRGRDPQADLPELTAARGLLALWVFTYHTNLHLLFAGLRGPVGCGYLGVDGFFILSGLVLAHRYPKLPLRLRPLGHFWWRRFIRLYPTVLAILGLLLAFYGVAVLLGLHPHDALRASRREFILQLLLLNGLGLSQGWSWNYPSWSISTEWVGYLLFPLLAAGMMRLRARAALVLLGLALAFLLWRAGIAPVGLNLSYQGALSRFLPEFLAGVLAARLLFLGRLPRGWLLPGGAALLLAAGLWLHPRWSLSDGLIVSGLWCLLAWLAATDQTLLARLPGLVPFGRLSYCFYMAYAPVEVVFSRGFARLDLDPRLHPLPWLVLFFLADLGLALLVSQFIERPAIRHLAGKRADG